MNKKTLIVPLLAVSVSLLAVSVFGTTFAAWIVTDNAESKGVGIHPAPGSLNVTFYSSFSNGDWVADSPIEKAYNSCLEVAEIPSISVSGYTFQGWSTNLPSLNDHNVDITSSDLLTTHILDNVSYYPILIANSKSVYIGDNSSGNYYAIDTDYTFNTQNLGSCKYGFKYYGIENGMPDVSDENKEFSTYDLLTTSGIYRFVDENNSIKVKRKVGFKVSDAQGNYWSTESTEKYVMYYFKEINKNQPNYEKYEGWTSVVVRNDNSSAFSTNFYVEAWYENVIFVRINNTLTNDTFQSADNKWAQNTVKWNQSTDIAISGNYSATNYVNEKDATSWDSWAGSWINPNS